MTVEIPNARFVWPPVHEAPNVTLLTVIACVSPSSVSSDSAITFGADSFTAGSFVYNGPVAGACPAGQTVVVRVDASTVLRFTSAVSALPHSRGPGFVTVEVPALIPRAIDLGSGSSAFAHASSVTLLGPRSYPVTYHPMSTHEAVLNYQSGQPTYSIVYPFTPVPPGAWRVNVTVVHPPVTVTMTPGQTLHGHGFSVSSLLWGPGALELGTDSARLLIPGATFSSADRDHLTKVIVATVAMLSFAGAWGAMYVIALLRDGKLFFNIAYAIGWFALWFHFVLLFHILRIIALSAWALLWLPMAYGFKWHIASSMHDLQIMTFKKSWVYLPEVAIIRMLERGCPILAAPVSPWHVRVFIAPWQTWWHTVLATSLLRPWAPWNRIPSANAPDAEKTISLKLLMAREGFASDVEVPVTIRAIFPSASYASMWSNDQNTASAAAFYGHVVNMSIRPNSSLDKSVSLSFSQMWLPLRVSSKAWSDWYLRWLMFVCTVYALSFVFHVAYAAAAPITRADVRGWASPTASPCVRLPPTAFSIVGAAGNWTVQNVPSDAPCYYAMGASDAEYLYIVNNGANLPLRVTNERFGLTVSSNTSVLYTVGCASTGMHGPPARMVPQASGAQTAQCGFSVPSDVAVLAAAECDFYTKDGQWNLITLYRGVSNTASSTASACLVGRPEDHYAVFYDLSWDPTATQSLDAFAIYATPTNQVEVSVSSVVSPLASSMVSATAMVYCEKVSATGCAATGIRVLRAGAPVLPAGASSSDVRFDLIGGIPIDRASAPAVWSAVGLVTGLSKAKRSAEFWYSTAPPYGRLPPALSFLSACYDFSGSPRVTTAVSVKVTTKVSLASSCPIPGPAAAVLAGLSGAALTCYLEGLHADATSTADATARTHVTQVSYGELSAAVPALPSAPDPSLFELPSLSWRGDVSLDGACDSAAAEPLSCQNRTAGGLCLDGLFHPSVLPSDCHSGNPFDVSGSNPDLAPFSLDGTWRGCSRDDPSYSAYACGATTTGDVLGCYARIYGQAGEDPFDANCLENAGNPLALTSLGWLTLSGPRASPVTANASCVSTASFSVTASRPTGTISAVVPSSVRAADGPCMAAAVNGYKTGPMIFLSWNGTGEGFLGVYVEGSFHSAVPCQTGYATIHSPLGIGSVTVSNRGHLMSVSATAPAPMVPVAAAVGPSLQPAVEGQSVRTTTSYVSNVSITTETDGPTVLGSSSSSLIKLLRAPVSWLHLSTPFGKYFADFLAALVWAALICGVAYLTLATVQWFRRRKTASKMR